MRSLTPAEFKDWLYRSRPNDKIMYYTGFLCHDRTYTVALGNANMVLMNKPVDEIGTAAWKAYEAGKVELFQERVGENTFRYLAVKKRR